MTRLIAWITIVLLSGHKVAQATEAKTFNYQTMAEAISAEASKVKASTFGEMITVLGGEKSQKFVSSLPKRISDVAQAKVERNGNTIVFAGEKSKSTLTLSDDGNTFSINGVMVPERVIDESIAKGDPSIIIHHLVRSGARKPTLLTLIDISLDLVAPEAHAFFGGGFTNTFPAQSYHYSPWSCYYCQMYGSWMGAGFISPYDWQSAYWGSFSRMNAGRIFQQPLTGLGSLGGSPIAQ